MSASLVGSEMCIRDRGAGRLSASRWRSGPSDCVGGPQIQRHAEGALLNCCLLYTSDAADDM
eukprot:950907-Alexandrium_andersonii.AAC.1